LDSQKYQLSGEPMPNGKGDSHDVSRRLLDCARFVFDFNRLVYYGPEMSTIDRPMMGLLMIR